MALAAPLPARAAEVLGISTNAASVRSVRALRKLTELMKRGGEASGAS